MPITIRSGQRYRARQVYSGTEFTIARYEREHAPDEWMFVIGDHINHRTMEFDEKDAAILESELQEVVDGKMSVADFETKLKGYFEEATQCGAISRTAANGSRAK